MDIDKDDYGKEWVLVVDDEKFVSQPIVGMLTHLGFQADSVDSGEEALKALNEKPYTILLTDIRMPKMNGLELLQQTRETFPDILTIIMTGYYMDYSWVDVVNSGASDFINKPFGIEEIEAKMKRVIAERNLKIELEKLSIKDSLTGLYNEKQFYTTLRDEVIRAERQNNPMALLFLELDNFTQDYGTQRQDESDKLLQEIGGILYTRTRQGVDTCYRFENGKFAVIVIDSDSEITHIIKNRIESSIQNEFQIDVSIGYAQFAHRLSPEDLIAATEQSLEEAKAEKHGPSNE